MHLASAGAALVALLVVGIVLTVGEPTGGAVTGQVRRTGVARNAAKVPRAARVPIEAALVSKARAENEQRLHDAQVAQFLAAAAEYYRPKTGVNWDGIATCETGGNWSMRGSKFSGGLGFYNGTWTGFGGREFASNAGLATREQQIVVAERVHARHGLSGWGCRAYG